MGLATGGLMTKIRTAIHEPWRIRNYLAARIYSAEFHVAPGGYALAPGTLFVTVNSVCNYRCKMCDYGVRDKSATFYNILDRGATLDFDRLTTLLDEVAEWRPVIAFVATEPLLWKRIVDAVVEVRRRGLDAMITTNGFLLPKYANDLVDAGLSVLNVSLDGPPPVHDAIRGVPGGYERAIEGIAMVRARRDAKPAPATRITVNYTISEMNAHCLRDFYELTRGAGSPGGALVDEITYSHTNYITPDVALEHNREFGSSYPVTQSSVSAVSPDRVDLETLHREVESVRTLPGVGMIPDLRGIEAIRTFYRDPRTFVTPRRCLVPWSGAYLLANGDVIALARCFDTPFGNIYESGFRDIWNGPRYRAFRSLIATRGALPACSRCCGVLSAT